MFGETNNINEKFRIGIDTNILIDRFFKKIHTKWTILFFSICEMNQLQSVKSDILLKEINKYRYKHFNDIEKMEKEKIFYKIIRLMIDYHFKSITGNFKEDIEQIKYKMKKEIWSLNQNTADAEHLATAWCNGLRLYVSHNFHDMVVSETVELYLNFKHNNSRRRLQIVDCQDLVMHFIYNNLNKLITPGYHPRRGNTLCSTLQRYANTAENSFNTWLESTKNLSINSPLPLNSLESFKKAHEYLWRLGFLLQNERRLMPEFDPRIILQLSILPEDQLEKHYYLHQNLISYQKDDNLPREIINELQTINTIITNTLTIFIDKLKTFQIKHNEISEEEYIKARGIINGLRASMNLPPIELKTDVEYTLKPEAPKNKVKTNTETKP